MLKLAARMKQLRKVWILGVALALVIGGLAGLNVPVLVINTTESRKGVIADSRLIRISALAARVPYYTTIAGARAACMGLGSMREMVPYDLHGLHALLRAGEAN